MSSEQMAPHISDDNSLFEEKSKQFLQNENSSAF